MMRVESLSLYWNPTATALDDVEIAHITPMQYYNWKHYMLTGLDKFSMHHEDFEFCKYFVQLNSSKMLFAPIREIALTCGFVRVLKWNGMCVISKYVM